MKYTLYTICNVKSLLNPLQFAFFESVFETQLLARILAWPSSAQLVVLFHIVASFVCDSVKLGKQSQSRSHQPSASIANSH